jgi:hypothetical protein
MPPAPLPGGGAVRTERRNELTERTDRLNKSPDFFVATDSGRFSGDPGGGGARAHDAQSLLIRKLPTPSGSENLAEFRFVFGLIFALRAPRVKAAPEPGSAGLL